MCIQVIISFSLFSLKRLYLFFTFFIFNFIGRKRWMMNLGFVVYMTNTCNFNKACVELLYPWCLLQIMHHTVCYYITLMEVLDMSAYMHMEFYNFLALFCIRIYFTFIYYRNSKILFYMDLKNKHLSFTIFSLSFLKLLI